MTIARCGFVLALAASAASACKSNSPGTGGTGGSGTGGDRSSCDGLTAHVQSLYQADAARGEEKTRMTADEVADNVAMVLAECRAAPARVVPCATKASSVAELERSCLVPLDDEGSEGTALR